MNAAFWRVSVVVLAALFVLALADLRLLDPALLGRGARSVGEVVRGLFPPDPRVLATLAGAMAETIEIAFVGTAIGSTLALPFALAASPRLFGPLVTVPVRLVLAFLRAMPSLFWGILFVVLVGIGPAAGALAIALSSLGYVGRLLYESLDARTAEVVEAGRSRSLGRIRLTRDVLLPEARNAIMVEALPMFAYNVRTASIVGFVGAGGIGFYLLGYVQLLRYDQMFSALLVMLAVILLIDRLSARVRRHNLRKPAR